MKDNTMTETNTTIINVTLYPLSLTMSFTYEVDYPLGAVQTSYEGSDYIYNQIAKCLSTTTEYTMGPKQMTNVEAVMIVLEEMSKKSPYRYEVQNPPDLSSFEDEDTVY